MSVIQNITDSVNIIDLRDGSASKKDEGVQKQVLRRRRCANQTPSHDEPGFIMAPGHHDCLGEKLLELQPKGLHPAAKFDLTALNR